MGYQTALQHWFNRGQDFVAGLRGQRGQTMMEAAMVMGFVAMMAITVLTAVGDVTGGAFAEVSQVFAGPEQESIPSDVYLGPRIAD
jgi:Flp pilus assembly pilin Flp